jgi:biotin transport system substrate-specific component
MDSVRALLVRRWVVPRALLELLTIFAFTLLIVLGAFVYIPLPFTPVPITMQVFFVLLAGLMLGGRSGTMSVLLYILAGTMGFPIFAGAVGGIARILGPTGGYLLGFLLAPGIIAFLYNRLHKGLFAMVLSLVAGVFTIYCCGMLHLALFLHIPLHKALQAGVYPFILGDTLKIILALFVVQLTRRSPWNLLNSFRK